MRLLIRNGRAVGIGKKLLITNDRHCCCNDRPELAYLFCECCDGDPCFWIAQRAFPNGQMCELLKDTGSVDTDGRPTCYGLRDIDRLEAVLSQDNAVRLTRGNLQCADIIMPCNETLECRTCPTSCCIFGYVPRCGQSGSDCCNLGSAYEMVYTYNYYFLDQGSYGCEVSTVSDPSGGYSLCCQAYSGLIREVKESKTYRVKHYKTGGACGFRRSTGSNQFSYQERNLRHDGFIREPIPNSDLTCISGLVNGRIEEINTSSADSLIYIGRGQYPWGTVDNCNFQRSTGQAIGCAWQTDDRILQAGMSCLSGFRNSTRITRTMAGCCDRGPACFRMQTTIIQESYFVNILDRTGCETTDCGSISPLLRPPAPYASGRFNINRTRDDLSVTISPLIQEQSKRGCMSCRSARGI